MKAVEEVRDRLDAMASEALEKVIGKAEIAEEVHVTDVRVDVAPHPPGLPTVDVSVTVKRN